MTGVQPAGRVLFARYAYAPNARGYCGPAAAADLRAVAGGGGAGVDVPALARQFSGAWPYQLLMGELTGLDPLGEEVGRAYWTGSDLTHRIDARRLGELLLERFAGQAGHYWTHLDPSLLAEVTPTHIFHVLGVYPWSRLLRTGLPEPLAVLDSCRIRVGEVTGRRADRWQVLVDTLTWNGRQLGLAEPRMEELPVDEPGPTGPLSVGDLVAIHWGLACDRLRPEQAEILLALTERQLQLTNRRLG